MCPKYLRLLNINFSIAFIILAALSVKIKDIFDSILYSKLNLIRNFRIFFEIFEVLPNTSFYYIQNFRHICNILTKKYLFSNKINKYFQ